MEGSNNSENIDHAERYNIYPVFILVKHSSLLFVESSEVTNPRSLMLSSFTNQYTSCRRHLDFNENSPSVETDIPAESIPHVGREFETEQDAYNFYLAYSRLVGFGIRRHSKHDEGLGNMVDRIFFCSAEGERGRDRRDVNVKRHRSLTRFGCLAKLRIKRVSGGKFEVVHFISEHNHPLASPRKSHLYRCHRNVSASAGLQIEMAYDVGIPPKSSHALMAKESGGRENLGFIPEDFKNYLRSKRTIDCKIGDTSGVLEYLQQKQFDDPGFYHAFQLDADDLITNIFWCDSKMRSDFSYFGDVVSFDTTYRMNKEGRPMELFVGVNHHKQSILFGAALLYDETALTFEWLFRTFTTAMYGKMLKTMLTDQDTAMAKALASTWPQTNHRLCIWHIFQNATIHLSSVFHQFREFSRDFSSCIYDFDEEEEFIAAWNEMLTRYSLEDNVWLKRMFSIRQKWALAYGRHMFCADMTTTQRSESMNSLLKKYMSYKHKFLEFFKHFSRLVEERRYDESRADLKSTTSAPSLTYPIGILIHASGVYTHEVFKYFEQQWVMSHDCCLEMLEDNGTHTKYRFTASSRRYDHTLTFDKNNNNYECSCRKFEFGGILCAHIVKIFTIKNVMKIPADKILKRWTKSAKVEYFGVMDRTENNRAVDPRELQHIRYRDLCGMSMQLFHKASEREDTYKQLRDVMLSQGKLVDVKLHQDIDQETPSPVGVAAQGEGTSTRVKGIKSKKKTESGKRLKGCLEKNSKRRKPRRRRTSPPTTNPPSNSMPTVDPLSTPQPRPWDESLSMESNTPLMVLLSENTSYM